MDVAITYDAKKKLHYIVRIVPRVAVGWTGKADVSALLNELLVAKTPSSLIKAFDNAPALYPAGTFAGRKYAFAFKEAESELASYSTCNEAQLHAELLLNSAKELRFDSAGIGQFAIDNGCSGAEFVERLKDRNSSEHIVLIEQLQDWMTLRNSLSVCARLLGQVERMDEPVSLEEAGFELRSIRRLGGDYFITPFKFNTYFAASQGKDWEQKDPLFYALFPVEDMQTEWVPILGNISAHYPDPKNKDVFFATQPIATGEYAKLGEGMFISKNRPVGTKTYYLVVKKSVSDDELARSIVSAFTRAFRDLQDPVGGFKKKKGQFRPLGWSYDEAGEFEGLDAPRYIPNSLPSALWYQLIYHPGKEIIVCAECKNAAINVKKGRSRDYCSDLCRVRASKEGSNARRS